MAVEGTYSFDVDWSNNGSYGGTGEDITSRVRKVATIQYGRAQSRRLSPVTAGRVTIPVVNTSGDYYPDNGSSPISGDVLPGRDMRVQVNYSSTDYDLFNGTLHDLQFKPDRGNRSVDLVGLDVITVLARTQVTLYGFDGSNTTGDLIEAVLDEVGITGHSLDPGSTTSPMLNVVNGNAWGIIQELVAAEGPPAIFFIAPDGTPTFWDRQHRLVAAASGTSQATFRDTGTEPVFTDFSFDMGWRDVYNKVRVPWTSWMKSSDTVAQTVWDGLQLQLDSGSTFTADLASPAYAMTATNSGAGTASLSVTEGNQVTITASGGAVSDILITGKPFVQTAGEVEVEDSSSITEYGERVYSVNSRFVQDEEQAGAVANKILNERKDPRRTVRVTVDNDHDSRFTQALTRTLSDRITVVDAESSVNGEFYIERVEHRIAQAGKHHRTTFGCETVNTELVPTPIILDSSTVGERLDEGELAY